MTDAELRDMAARAAMAATGVSPSVDPFVLYEEQRGGEVNAGHYGMSGGGSSAAPGRFELTLSSDGNSYTFENRYYDVGGRTFSATDTRISSSSFSGIVALSVSMTGAVPSAGVVTYADIGAMQNDQKDFSKYVIPLYKMKDGAVECDFRVGPPAVAREFAG